MNPIKLRNIIIFLIFLTQATSSISARDYEDEPLENQNFKLPVVLENLFTRKADNLKGNVFSVETYIVKSHSEFGETKIDEYLPVDTIFFDEHGYRVSRNKGPFHRVECFAGRYVSDNIFGKYQVTKYRHDTNTRIVVEDGDTTTYKYKYDDSGRLIQFDVFRKGGNESRTLFDYIPGGFTTTQYQSARGEGKKTEVKNNQYKTNGSIGNYFITVDNTGRILSKRDESMLGKGKTDYAYNSYGDLAKVTNYYRFNTPLDRSDPSVKEYKYKYDEHGNWIENRNDGKWLIRKITYKTPDEISAFWQEVSQKEAEARQKKQKERKEELLKYAEYLKEERRTSRSSEFPRPYNYGGINFRCDSLLDIRHHDGTFDITFSDGSVIENVSFNPLHSDNYVVSDRVAMSDDGRFAINLYEFYDENTLPQWVWYVKKFDGEDVRSDVDHAVENLISKGVLDTDIDLKRALKDEISECGSSSYKDQCPYILNYAPVRLNNEIGFPSFFSEDMYQKMVANREKWVENHRLWQLISNIQSACDLFGRPYDYARIRKNKSYKPQKVKKIKLYPQRDKNSASYYHPEKYTFSLKNGHEYIDLEFARNLNGVYFTADEKVAMYNNYIFEIEDGVVKSTNEFDTAKFPYGIYPDIKRETINPHP